MRKLTEQGRLLSDPRTVGPAQQRKNMSVRNIDEHICVLYDVRL